MNENSEIVYEETLKRNSLNGIKGFLLIVGLVFGSLGLILIVGFIQYLTGIGYLQFILLVAVLVSCFYIVKAFLTNYIYIILKDSICIGRAVGKREKIIAQFRFSDVVYFGKYDESASAYCYGRKQERATYKRIDNNTDCFVIKDRYLLVNVSDEFIKKYEEVK